MSKKWHFSATFDPYHWVLLIGFRYYFWWSFEFYFLCWHLRLQYYTDDEPTPEEELRQLNEYADEQLKFISEERAELLAQMGITKP